MGELGSQVWVAHGEIDIVTGRGQRLELAGRGCPRAAVIIEPQSLPVGERIGEINSGRQVHVVMGYIDVLRGIETVEIGELQPRSKAEIDLVLMELVIQRETIAVARKLIRVAEQAVEAGIALERIDIVIRVVGGGTTVI
jgi:hypothetical protein